MHQLWRRPLWHLKRLSKIGTGKIIFWPFQEFLCNSNKDPSTIYRASETMGPKHPISNWFWHWSAVVEVHFESLPNTIGHYQQPSSLTWCIEQNNSRTSSSTRWACYKYQYNFTWICCFKWSNEWWYGMCCCKYEERRSWSMKRGVHEDSSDDDININPIKKSASSSPAGKRTGTRV